MTALQLVTPANVGTRDLVRAWLDSALPGDLADTAVDVDCAPLTAPTPSFIDELLKIIVVERKALRVRLVNASERAVWLAQRSADNRHISDVVMIEAAAVPRGSLLERLRR
jgi:hypothetical protein